jgi:hypothetical protein
MPSRIPMRISFEVKLKRLALFFQCFTRVNDRKAAFPEQSHEFGMDPSLDAAVESQLNRDGTIRTMAL